MHPFIASSITNQQLTSQHHCAVGLRQHMTPAWTQLACLLQGNTLIASLLLHVRIFTLVLAWSSADRKVLGHTANMFRIAGMQSVTIIGLMSLQCITNMSGTGVSYSSMCFVNY